MREPSNLYAAHGLGMLLLEQMKLDDAKRVFQTLKEHYPRHVGAWINLGHVYMMQDRPVRCIVSFTLKTLTHYFNTGYRGKNIPKLQRYVL
jgi:predicted Zn-dependent protease